MKNIKLTSLVLGISNIIIGFILSSLVILMQNVIAFVAGISYIIFGIAMFFSRIYKNLLFWVIIPLTALYSFNIAMIVINKDLPRYLRIPTHVGLIMTVPLWILIFANIWLLKNRIHSSQGR